RPPKAGGGPTKYHRLAFRNSLHQAPPAPMYNLDSKAAADLDFTRAALWRRIDALMSRKAVEGPSMNKPRDLL
ncbi:MAG: hypothetical protein RQ993_06000, partial [Bacteroidota bacterium]|nr:hypothetical protein [Bacteroidota bacterium]